MSPATLIFCTTTKPKRPLSSIPSTVRGPHPALVYTQCGRWLAYRPPPYSSPHTVKKVVEKASQEGLQLGQHLLTTHHVRSDPRPRDRATHRLTLPLLQLNSTTTILVGTMLSLKSSPPSKSMVARTDVKA